MSVKIGQVNLRVSISTRRAETPTSSLRQDRRVMTLHCGHAFKL
jgi:hypothetical protein